MVPTDPDRYSERYQAPRLSRGLDTTARLTFKEPAVAPAFSGGRRVGGTATVFSEADSLLLAASLTARRN